MRGGRGEQGRERGAVLANQLGVNNKLRADFLPGKNAPLEFQFSSGQEIDQLHLDGPEQQRAQHFQAQPGLHQVKLTFSASIQHFGLKTTSHGKSDFKNEFFRSGLPCGEVFRPKN